MSKPARPRIATALVDFESRSRCNLKKRGGRLYWEDPSTEAICAVLYDVERREWHVWEPGDPVPSIGTAVAHNAANFDRFGGARCDWRVQEWIDSSQAARRAGLPGALDKLGKMWLGRDKDKDGSRFTIALSRPSRAKARKGQLPELTGPVRDRVVAYCANDVEIMVKAWPRLEEWFDVDADTCEVDRVINDRGVYLDKDLCRALQKQIARQQEKAIAKAAKALGWSVQETRACAMSPQQFVKATGLENARKDTLAAFNPECEGTTEAAPLVAVRLALASVVPGKLTAALERVSPDNRLRDMLRYYGAHTGRWAGTGLQPHNLNRIGFEDEAKRIGWAVEHYIQTLCDAALSGEDLGDTPVTDVFRKSIGGDVGKYIVSGLLRSVLVAEPGCTYAVLDYSGVEARANAWAAGDDNAIGVFKALDAGTGPDPYKLMAVDIFGLPLERVEKHHRQIGKNAELGCGYGMGADKFNDYCAAAGNDLAAMGVEASDVIGAWRTKHRPIVKMWHACEKAFAAAAQGRPMRAGKWLYEPRGNGVACVLPSGRPIMYPNAKVRRVKRTAKDGRTFDAWDMSYQGADPWRSPVYGGLLVENAIQALCRDFLAGALVKLDAAGLRPVLHVHDEAVCEVPHNAGAEALEEMRQIMLDVPRWAKGFPMRLDGFHGRRYRK
jgi:DNA polymerase